MTLTNRERFFKKHNIPLDKSLSLKEIASLSKMPIKALDEVRLRGLGAHKNNLLSVRLKSTGQKNILAPKSQKMSAAQWSFGRIYSFVMKQKGTYYGADQDIKYKYKI